jgi:lysophospholipase L1-like esterase
MFMMRRIGFFCLLVTLCCTLVAQAQVAKPVIEKGARVAIVGDSITEQRIYSRFIELYLAACMPQLETHVMQFGWSGEMARGMASRLDNDLLPYKPSVVTICFGMNDGGYRAYDPSIGKAYEAPMRDMVTRLKNAGATTVVGSPGAVDSYYYSKPNSNATVYNENLRQLGEVDRQIAEDLQMPFADLHTVMMDAMGKAKASLGDKFDVCGREGVHPGQDGHVVMAYALLKAMNFDGDLGTITMDMTGNAKAENGHTVVGGKGGQVEIESTRYPFCFFGGEKDSNGTRSILPYLPFNQDLNRLTLVVKNLKSEQAKVTWGKSSKTFTREQLEKGINLAAEFLDNPFCDAFTAVDDMVKSKQAFETTMIKEIITKGPVTRRTLGDDADGLAALQKVHSSLWTRQEQFNVGVHDAVKPVKHTITVEEITANAG